MEALAYVKAEHLQEKKMAHMKNMSDFKMQMRSVRKPHVRLLDHVLLDKSS